MRVLEYMSSSAAALILFSSYAAAQTWICDGKASVGFDSRNGYEIQKYSADTSYRIRAGISASSISSSYLRLNSIFFDAEGSGRIPASIERIDIDFVGLCEMVEINEQVICNYPMPFGTNFDFSLKTGQFSMLAGGYEDGGVSWVEVGECRRIQ